MRGSHAHGRVAQLVEQGIENPRAGGSIPSPATMFKRKPCNGSSRCGAFRFWPATWPVHVIDRRFVAVCLRCQSHGLPPTRHRPDITESSGDWPRESSPSWFEPPSLRRPSSFRCPVGMLVVDEMNRPGSMRLGYMAEPQTSPLPASAGRREEALESYPSRPAHHPPVGLFGLLTPAMDCAIDKLLSMLSKFDANAHSPCRIAKKRFGTAQMVGSARIPKSRKNTTTPPRCWGLFLWNPLRRPAQTRLRKAGLRVCIKRAESHLPPDRVRCRLWKRVCIKRVESGGHPGAHVRLLRKRVCIKRVESDAEFRRALFALRKRVCIKRVESDAEFRRALFALRKRVCIKRVESDLF